MTAFTSLPQVAITLKEGIPPTILIDKVTASLSYIGKAPSGSLTSEAVWQIKSLDTADGDVALLYADGGAFSQIWDNRAALTYST